MVSKALVWHKQILSLVLWVNFSADNILDFFFFFFYTENRHGHFMQIVSKEDN